MDKTKWEGESKSAIPEDDLLTLQMLQGEREKGKRRSQTPPISFLQAAGMNRRNLDSFRTAASLPPTKRSWTTLQPLKNPVHFILLSEACSCTDLCHHIYFLSSLHTDSLLHIHIAPTLGSGVPKLWYQYPSLYVEHFKAAPECQ